MVETNKRRHWPRVYAGCSSKALVYDKIRVSERGWSSDPQPFLHKVWNSFCDNKPKIDLRVMHLKLKSMGQEIPQIMKQSCKLIGAEEK